jgi:hypothetical protein
MLLPLLWASVAGYVAFQILALFLTAGRDRWSVGLPLLIMVPIFAWSATGLVVGYNTGKQTSGEMFQAGGGIAHDRLHNRQKLLTSLDRLRGGLDQSGSLDAVDRYQQQVIEMVLGQRAPKAFDLGQEPETTRERYGKHLWCQQAITVNLMTVRCLRRYPCNFLSTPIAWTAASALPARFDQLLGGDYAFPG